MGGLCINFTSSCFFVSSRRGEVKGLRVEEGGGKNIRTGGGKEVTILGGELLLLGGWTSSCKFLL